jgi:hypothetical protein
MISISDLQDIHAGRPAAVLGGGPSLPEDLKQIPTGCVLISVNQHALQLVKADYLVFLDDPLTEPDLLEAIRAFEGIKVSRRREWADVELGPPVAKRRMGQYTGHVAALFAEWLGCDPLLLLGMDCYQGGQIYFYQRPRWRQRRLTMAKALGGWKQVKKDSLHPERIKAVSGPLVDVFGKCQERP